MERGSALKAMSAAPAPLVAPAPVPAPYPVAGPSPVSPATAPFGGPGPAYPQGPAPATGAAGGNTIALLRAEGGGGIAPAGPGESAAPEAEPTAPMDSAVAAGAAGATAEDAGAAMPAGGGEAAAPSARAGPAAQGAPASEGAAAGGGGGGRSAALRILGRSLPSGAGAAVAASRASAEAEVAHERAALEAAPPSLEAPSGLAPAGAEARDAYGEVAAAAAARGVEEVDGAGQPPEAPETGHVVSEEPVPTGPSPDAVVDRAPEDPTARAERFRDMIARMPASDDSVNTDPGPPEPLLLTDEADPGRVATQAAANKVTIDAEWQGARRGMSEDEGVDDIYPTLPDEMLVAPVVPGGGTMRPVAEPENPPLRPGVRAGFDEGLGPAWNAEVASADTGHAEALATRRRDEATKRAETDREIARLEGEAATEQAGYKEQAHSDVADARAGWQAEIDAARGTYDGERTRIDRDLNRDVAAEVTKAEGDAQRELDAGQSRAEDRRISTETEAERRRAEAERRRDEADGFFDWVASKVKSFFRALQEGLKVLFDGLRAAVRGIIEGAKRLAAAAIELGRRAVVGLIRLAGAALELAADVFLAAFPEARDRAKALIRAGTDRAEEAVNRAAEALRAAVFAALDALGDALCFILDVYEAFYSKLFSVFEALVVGFVEVARALFRLDLAAQYAPGEMEGQIYEEMIGADLTQPLVFEATEREIAEWEAGLSSGGGGLGVDAGSGLTAGPATMPGEVEADPVVPFDPEPDLLADLDFSRGPVEFEGNTGPGNTLADLHAEALATEGGVEEAGGAEAATGETGAVAGDGGPGSAIPGDTTDAKLDHYISQGAPNECRTTTPTAPEGPPMPLAAKIGPLSKSQRARYMLNQAWTGIKHWVGCNWPTILAAVLVAIIAIAAIVAVVVLSGGTVGLALTGLLTAFTGAMIIYAIARAAGFLGDYLQKSIDGDIIGGAKGLARALAVAAVEIIFAILTYVTAGVFRGIAVGIKGAGRLAAGAARGAGRLAAGAARQVGRGARAVGRGALKLGGGALRTTGRAGRAVGRVGSAVIRRGKLVITNVRSGFERGARTLRDLGKRLSQRLRFRRFKIERSGRWFKLYGLINPWVLLASGEIKRMDDLGDVEVGDLVSVPGKRQKGIVIGIKTRTGGGKGAAAAVDFDSQAVAALRAESKAARARFHKTHRASAASDIRAALDVAGETSRNAKILAQNMRNAPRPGRPAPSPGDAAHHLVPSTDARGALARKILAGFGIDVNDAANGLFLNAAKHARVHTNAGYLKITTRLGGAASKADALQILDDIADLILKNKFP